MLTLIYRRSPVYSHSADSAVHAGESPQAQATVLLRLYRDYHRHAFARDSLTSNLVPSRRQHERQRIRIHAPRSLPRPRRRASVSSLFALKVRPASGQRYIPQLEGEHSFHSFASTHSDCPLAHLFSYYGPMFKNFHDPEVTLASSRQYDPRSHPQESATPQSSYEEEMIATSLNVNYKKELSDIEQCGYPPSTHIS